MEKGHIPLDNSPKTTMKNPFETILYTYYLL